MPAHHPQTRSAALPYLAIEEPGAIARIAAHLESHLANLCEDGLGESPDAEDTRDALDHLASPAGQAPFGQVADHITLTSSNAMRMLKQACEDLAEQGPLGVSVVDPDLAR